MEMNISKIANTTLPAIHNRTEGTATTAQAKQQTNGNLQHGENRDIVKDVNKDEVKLAVEKINDFVDPIATNLKFVYHEDLNEYYVTVVNPLTDEVIREIPPKKLLDMYAAMTEYIGLVVDQKI